MTNCCHFKIYDQNKWHCCSEQENVFICLNKNFDISEDYKSCPSVLSIYHFITSGPELHQKITYNIVHVKTRLMKMCVKCSSMNYVKLYTWADFSFFSVISISRRITNPTLFTTRVSVKMKQSQGVISGSFWIYAQPKISPHMSLLFFFTSY